MMTNSTTNAFCTSKPHGIKRKQSTCYLSKKKATYVTKQCDKNNLEESKQISISHEDDKIFEGLTKNDIAFIKLIAPTNDSNYIKQSLKKSSSWLYIVSYAGVTGSKEVNLDNVKRLSKMIRKQSKIPIGVGFGIKNYDDVKKVSKLADLVVCGSSIVE